MRVELDGVVARHPAAVATAAPALAGLNVRVGPGEQVAVIGPSGAGKTTFLQVLAGALPPSAGAVRLAGQNPWRLSGRALQALRGRLCLAPQVPPLPPRQRVVTSVLAGRLPQMGFWASLGSLLYPSDIPAAHRVLARLDLADKLFDRVDRLSGGERQRVGLARALLALEPMHAGAAAASLLLVDEPLSALDPTRARQAIDVLLAAARAQGATLVASLHQVDVALSRFPRILGLREGVLMFDLPSAEVTQAHLARLYDHHEHELHGGAHADWAALGAALPNRAVAAC